MIKIQSQQQKKQLSNKEEQQDTRNLQLNQSDEQRLNDKCQNYNIINQDIYKTLNYNANKYKQIVLIVITFILIMIILLKTSSIIQILQYPSKSLIKSIQKDNSSTYQQSTHFQQTINSSQNISLRILQLKKFLLYQCPKKLSQVQGVFHIHLPDPSNTTIVPYQLIQRSHECNIPILRHLDLKKLISKWNQQQKKQNIINRNYFNTTQQRYLLIFLNLYYNGGIYVNLYEPLLSIQNRCWKYTVLGFQLLFIDWEYINQKGIRIPNIDKFIRVGLRRSDRVKQVIYNIINKLNYLSFCQQKQCLIIKCKED